MTLKMKWTSALMLPLALMAGCDNGTEPNMTRDLYGPFQIGRGSIQNLVDEMFKGKLDRLQNFSRFDFQNVTVSFPDGEKLFCEKVSVSPEVLKYGTTIVGAFATGENCRHRASL